MIFLLYLKKNGRFKFGGTDYIVMLPRTFLQSFYQNNTDQIKNNQIKNNQGCLLNEA
jgi:hypothetical protein